MTVAVSTLCMGCAAPEHQDPGSGSCIQLSPGGFDTVAAVAALGCVYLFFFACLLAFLKLLVIILDTGASKRLKIGWGRPLYLKVSLIMVPCRWRYGTVAVQQQRSRMAL